MGIDGRKRAVWGGAGFLAITALLVSGPADDAAPLDDPGPGGGAEQSERIEAVDAPVLADASAQPDAASGARAPGPLRGATGAATALSIGDPALCLSLLDTVERGAPGTDAWFAHGAMRGRALRQTDKPGEAVAVLAALAAVRTVGQHFPKELLLLELAGARIEHAASGALSLEDADIQRRIAAKELYKASKLSPIRALARMRVLRANALAQVVGSSPHASKAAALSAVKAMAGIIKDYPNHPMIGVHRMAHAAAIERTGKLKDAAAAYRRITIERAGEPEEAQAWAAYERVTGSTRTLSARPLLITEQLDQAVWARSLRRVERSREILDAIIDDADTPPFLRGQALSSRAYTAYKQRDFAQCADDLRPSYEATGNAETEGRLFRCLERGAQYDEALAIAMRGTKSKRRASKARAYWQSLDLAVRAGMYAKAEELLGKYEKLSNANRGDRVWLRAWLPYRQGRHEEAIAAFDKVPRGSPKDATRARYFRAKLALASTNPTRKAEGEAGMRALALAQPWGYYGLQARQRLLDAGVTPADPPPLQPVADEDRLPSRADATTVLRQLDEQYGKAWPPFRRMRQLYAAGYLEEARRELRVATTAVLGLSSRTRSEELIEGLGWKSNWKYPKVAPTKAGRKLLRDRVARKQMEVSLRTLSLALQEPPSYIRLIPNDEATRKARWHPRAYRSAVEREAAVRNVDPIHLWSLMYTESRFRRHVVSHVGARGALQIMPWTGRQLAERLDELPDGRFDADTLFDVDINAHLAAYYIAELLAKFHGQGAMAYASYNGGPSNVARWLRAKAKGPDPLHLDTFIEEMVFTESYRYAKRVMEVSAAYAMMYDKALPRWTNTVDANVEDNIDF